MTLKDWLKLNPNHKCTLKAAPGDEVRAVLHGGDGIDARLVGQATSEAGAIAGALGVRKRLVEQLRHEDEHAQA